MLVNRNAETHLFQSQCDKPEYETDPRQRTLRVEELVAAAEFYRARTSPRFRMRDNVLKIPQYVPIPLHVQV